VSLESRPSNAILRVQPRSEKHRSVIRLASPSDSAVRRRSCAALTRDSVCGTRRGECDDESQDKPGWIYRPRSDDSFVDPFTWPGGVPLRATRRCTFEDSLALLCTSLGPSQNLLQMPTAAQADIELIQAAITYTGRTERGWEHRFHTRESIQSTASAEVNYLPMPLTNTRPPSTDTLYICRSSSARIISPD
jgi:hypothetical protein